MGRLSRLDQKLSQRAQYRVCALVRTVDRLEVWTLQVHGATSGSDAYRFGTPDFAAPPDDEQREMGVQFMGTWLEDARFSAIRLGTYVEPITM